MPARSRLYSGAPSPALETPCCPLLPGTESRPMRPVNGSSGTAIGSAGIAIGCVRTAIGLAGIAIGSAPERRSGQLRNERSGPSGIRTPRAASPARAAQRATRQQNAMRRRHRAHHRDVARCAARDVGTPLGDTGSTRPARRGPAACGPAPRGLSKTWPPTRAPITRSSIGLRVSK